MPIAEITGEIFDMKSDRVVLSCNKFGFEQLFEIQLSPPLHKKMFWCNKGEEVSIKFGIRAKGHRMGEITTYLEALDVKVNNNENYS